MSSALRSIAAAVVLTTGVLAPPSTSLAVEKRVKFTVEVRIQGKETVVGKGSDRTTTRFREGYQLATHLKSNGKLEPVNIKDPRYTRKSVGAAAGGTGAPASTGGKDPRYLNYFGYENCGASARVLVDSVSTGVMGDASNRVPYTIKRQTNHRSTDQETRMLCSAHMFVLDTRSDTIFSDGAIMPTAPGMTTTIMHEKSTQESGDAAMHGEIMAWVKKQLRQVPRTGKRSETIKLTQNPGAALHAGTYSGQAKVEISWKLEAVN